jgi:monooxygenase
VSTHHSTSPPVAEHFDVLVVGAGLSGIGAAYHLQTRCPTRSYAILEAREAIGGTWDLFRYPGVRSDSDMYTLGYRFRPWREAKAIADGPSILRYIRETAAEHGIDRHIRFGQRVARMAWSSEDARWTVDAETTAGVVRYTCEFVYACTGYYEYEAGYTPEWPDLAKFGGRVVHPQQWPEHLDYAGRRVVVIGSGATAVTLVPAMAERAAHVTMLQRSPTYVFSLPSRDRVATWLREHLPERLAYALARWKNVLLSMAFYQYARRRPERMKTLIRHGVRARLGQEYDIDTHFAPHYDPWDQRLCFVPDGDLFKAIRSGSADVVTDAVIGFDAAGIRLKSGARLDADIIVTATGLRMRILNGVTLTVDGAPVALSSTMAYKGAMYSDIPNLASALGYTNASWTLKCDLTAEYVCRLLNHMAEFGYGSATPRRDPSVAEAPVIDFTSGYVLRALASLPRQGTRTPWKLHQNYAWDLVTLRFGALEDGTMHFEPLPITARRRLARRGA